MISFPHKVLLFALVWIEQSRRRVKWMFPFAFGWSALIIVSEVKTRDNHHGEQCD